ncbi:protein-S-isoprenylcysteine O-methyltransferase-like [Gordionus sp. m RMFG-2023]|uniref:protein-S-isoprenylcysteine O-methyltransferase-like n=1 Tax=Gordionus sp. m RMFG-2023 TaxID=3053472 RepID=UPI0031FD897C
MSFFLITGSIICIIGDLIRKTAMFTAGKSFNHLIQYSPSNSHVLVTKGIYRICRHPSYLGWFLWCLGTQILLCNPVCFVGYLITSWRFFNQRIMEEEYHLIKFFGSSYIEYKYQVASGLPLISGYPIDPDFKLE